MTFSVQMPALGESVTEGTVTRWLKEEGDTVEADEPLLEVSTDKVDTEIPAPASGVLIKIVAHEDDVVEIGGELAVIGDASESAGDAPAATPPAAEEPAAPEPAAEPAAEPEPAAPAAPAAPASAAEGTEVVMPALGESVTEGTVTNWLKAVGDEVSEDEPLLEVSTDKVDTEIPAPASGTLLAIFAQEDDVVEVGGKLAIIGAAGAVPAAAPAAPAPAPEPEPEPESEPEPEPVAAAPEPEPAPAPAETATVVKADPPTIESTPYVTPLVRKLAAENNIDLNTVKGTGVGGRIRKQDVLAAAEAAKAPAPAAPAAAAPAAASAPAATAAGPEVKPELAALRGTTQKANRIRLITAKKTRESLQESAQLTQVFEVDMSKIVSLRKAAKESFKSSEGVNLTFLPFIAKAVVEALKAHPNVNASIDEGAKEITYYGNVHLGIAVDTDQGLLSPVIHNADDLSIAGLARAIADIAARARSGGLKPDELAGGTFTITNIGSQGALFDTPILVPPQAAMLGTGAIVKRPVVVTEPDGSDVIAIRSMSYLPLTYDHRLIDGADAGRFLTTVKKRLEGGSFAADLGL
ncbi:2-oxoglutarate dehydrogenase, E2 component, dihydrolipoamide succinyltransferase [Gordonia amarae]|uniref:Dihydrolipoamide acetyltransferase component of pyruvate dehydrogenase complex n=2 Tax=Gordonia amarae TaxID=36821 RepID=G7GPT2_9ACTN|nr:2-oxoglutarate dehydrogenase, E2 component, dihydrolipoamide succinyltransferase [Gordonia amarae]MCS3879624.1 2-oxoglutarate dehydrogenase E2 component (dihydrolipoamide succinyltransferase) [Gordonia amarae]QHN40205.1 2-oxoglutarate dehydrogenase, E2 component, dihydrolipoamide succinyltransferase [Gordonia amarae]GAB05607.1 putative dihydrolipoamide acyltransferase [Gordonia amarae NBRC 15530]